MNKADGKITAEDTAPATTGLPVLPPLSAIAEIVIVFAMSFATRTPTAPPFSFGGEHAVLNTDHYARLATDSLYIRAYLNSIGNAALATVLCLLIGYPMALGLTRLWVDEGDGT